MIYNTALQRDWYEVNHVNMLCFCVRQFILIEPLITWASKLEMTRVLPVSLDRIRYYDIMIWYFIISP